MAQTILIVDDNLSAQETLEELLSGQGYDLVFASNGEEALAQAVQLSPDIIVLDVMMPGIDGFEVCRRLRVEPRLAEVPVIMVTALDDRQSRLQGIEAGADDFISKPFDRLELRARIRTIMQLNRYRRLHAERTKFEWVVEQAKDAYLIVSGDDTIRYANLQARRYFDLPAGDQELSCIPFLEIARQQYRGEPEEAWLNWPAGRAGQPPAYLVRPESATTKGLWLQVDCLAISGQADQEYLVHLSDITTTMATERLMWTFHGQVSHKLRMPVTLLTGFLELLNQDEAGLSEDFRHLLGVVYNNAVKLRDEVQSIFQYLETPYLVRPGLAGCRLAEIPDIVAALKASLALEPVRLTSEGPARPEAHLLLSRPAVELILEEVMGNAKKFHPSGAPIIDIKTIVNTTDLVIQVSDDGSPLPPDQLARIWTPYYQAEKNFTGQVAGMGLGLSRVAFLIWNVGGSCQAYNRSDPPGLVIELSIPMAKGSQA
jgi:two-component system cell cycle response regulator